MMILDASMRLSRIEAQKTGLNSMIYFEMGG
jgi:hypothetical protein